MESATRLIRVETRAAPNSAPQPSTARMSFAVQERSASLISLTRLSSISGRSPRSSAGCSTNASKNSCCPIQEPNHLDRDTCRQPWPALSVACSNSARRPVKRRWSDLSYQTIQTRPAGGASTAQGSRTCLLYAVRMSSNVFKFRHPQGGRHRLTDRYFGHIAR